MGAGLDCAAYRLYARSVCGTKSAAAAAVYGLWRYVCVICLWLKHTELKHNYIKHKMSASSSMRFYAVVRSRRT